METRRLLWFMALFFSVVFLVQYIEIPYGYDLSSLLSFGKSPSASRGTFPTRSSSNDTENLVNQTGSSVVKSMKLNATTKHSKDSFSNRNDHVDDNISRGSSTKTENFVNQTGFNVANSTKLNATSKHSKDSTGDGKDRVESRAPPNDAENLVNKSFSVVNSTKLNTTSKNSEDSFGSSNDLVDDNLSRGFLGINNSSRDNRVVRNKSLAPEMVPTSIKDGNLLRVTSPHLPNLPSNVSPPENPRVNQSSGIESLRGNETSQAKDPGNILQNDVKPSLTRSDLSTFAFNLSITRDPANTRRFKGPPAVVVPITEMNDMLSQSRLSYQPMKSKRPSQVDKELLNAKKLIESASVVEKNPQIDFNVYRNFSAFSRSYELMEQTLKIYIYSEGEKPIFHQPELNGIYASEGWFMKQLEENKHFVTTNPQKAHLFYLPFSSHVLQEVLYVPNSHSRKNLVRYLNGYLQNITRTYHFWDRVSGADHFLVACHDWAPAETSRIMKNTIRALCNADVKGGFQFGKDISLPETYIRNATNPLKNLGGKPSSQRHILAFFAGKMHGYLRPLLLNFWENKDPDMKIFGKLNETQSQMSYIQYMKSSKYCISARGYEAYTPRVVEAIFYECVPVIISDNYVPPFFETLNWESFAVFVLEKDIPRLKSILRGIPEKKYIEMQERVKQVQKHFLWHDRAVKYDAFHMILHSIWHTRVFQMRP